MHDVNSAGQAPSASARIAQAPASAQPRWAKATNGRKGLAKAPKAGLIRAHDLPLAAPDCRGLCPRAHLGAPELLVVDLSDAAVHAQGHVPGAVRLDYATLVAQAPPAMGLVPADARLSEALSAVGMTPASHVVAYDDAGGTKAGRLLWTLDLVGHAQASLLDGGLHAWSNEGHAVEGGEIEPRPSAFQAVCGSAVIADKAYVLAHLGEPDVVVLDTRTPAEFSGTDRRAARGGHIPGAVNFDWMLAVDTARNMRLKPEADLRALLVERGVTPDREIIPPLPNPPPLLAHLRGAQGARLPAHPRLCRIVVRMGQRPGAAGRGLRRFSYGPARPS